MFAWDQPQGQVCQIWLLVARFVSDITLLATTYHCVQNLEHLRGNTNAICNQWPRQFVVAEYHKILEVTEWLFTARGRHSG